MSSSSQAPQKKNKGRQKIKIQKMENQRNLQVTFSKRRAGLFKKASELCVLCAAETLLIVFSPAKKAFSYGHPDVESIVQRFLSGDAPKPAPVNVSIDQIIMEASRNSNIRTRNFELTQLNSSLAIERNRAKELDVDKRIGLKEGWIPPPFEMFSSEQLKIFEKAISNYQNHLDDEVAKFNSFNLNPTSFNNTNEQYATGCMNVTSNIGSSMFNANNNRGNSFGFNPNGIANNIGAGTVPFPHEFNSWAANIGETSIATNVGTIPDQNKFNNCTPCFRDTGVYATAETSAANNISAAVSVPTEFTDWIPGFDHTDHHSGVVSIQTEFDNWAQGFNNPGVYATGGTNGATNDSEVFVTSGTTGANNFGGQDPMGLIPNNLFTDPYDPNVAPGSVSDPCNLMFDDIFHGDSGPGVYPGFNDGGGSS